MLPPPKEAAFSCELPMKTDAFIGVSRYLHGILRSPSSRSVLLFKAVHAGWGSGAFLCSQERLQRTQGSSLLPVQGDILRAGVLTPEDCQRLLLIDPALGHGVLPQVGAPGAEQVPVEHRLPDAPTNRSMGSGAESLCLYRFSINEHPFFFPPRGGGLFPYAVLRRPPPRPGLPPVGSYFFFFFFPASSVSRSMTSS